jgi:hypothetical protein
MSSILRNAAAVLFLSAAFVSGSLRAAVDECPPALMGECLDCFTTPWGYVYSGCPEDCNFNESLCDNWCAGDPDVSNDSCHYDPEDGSCGDCDCGVARGPNARSLC